METARIRLKDMPYDRHFDNNDGEVINCHATGYAVQFDNEVTLIGIPVYWTEYVDSEGSMYYGN